MMDSQRIKPHFTIFFIGFLICFSSPIHAQSFSDSQNDYLGAEPGKKRKKENRRSKASGNKESQNIAKQKVELLDYDYEVMATLGFDLDQGALNKTGEDPEKFVDQKLSLDLKSGILIGDHFEPVIEIQYIQQTTTIGDYKSNGSGLSWGFGALFNIPILPEDFKRSNAPKGANAYALSNAKWIPFGGFVLSGSKISQAGGSSESTKVDEAGFRTKLIFGGRYMLYPHLALAMWARLSSEQSSSEVAQPVKSGGSINKFSLEMNLLSFTSFF